ncbi:hypothetical protein ElyMa_001967700 [Elysia marginata]|uniref:CTNNB1 binding N-teminal domain-containing protein n=1 Tax=Elysia marginata TaxID=1093978 RepID=A0AAV4EZX6_9GAST|nr:hypothetical protein ElyMa_001967700 [Elysia marginata]
MFLFQHYLSVSCLLQDGDGMEDDQALDEAASTDPSSPPHSGNNNNNISTHGYVDESCNSDTDTDSDAGMPATLNGYREMTPVVSQTLYSI